MKRAVLAAVLGRNADSRRLVLRAIENADGLGLKRMLDGIMISGGDLLKLHETKPSLSILDPLASALGEMIRYKDALVNGRVKSLSEFYAQQDMFAEKVSPESEILVWELDRLPSVKAIRDFFGKYLDQANRIDTTTGSLFGDAVPETTPREILEGIQRERAEQTAAAGEQGDLLTESAEMGKADRKSATPGAGTGGAEGSGTGELGPRVRESRQETLLAQFPGAEVRGAKFLIPVESVALVVDARQNAGIPDTIEVESGARHSDLVKAFRQQLDLFSDLLPEDKDDGAEALADLETFTEKVADTGVGDQESVRFPSSGRSLSRWIGAAGRVDLRGQRFESEAELAGLLQVYRDPRFETIRYVYVKNGRIIAHEGVTSGIPNAAPLHESKSSLARRMTQMQRRMERLGADGYYLVHNHPSGDVTPSRADIEVTWGFISGIPEKQPTAEVPRPRGVPGVKGFLGHIIINHDKFALIALHKDADGRSYVQGEQRSLNPKDVRKELAPKRGVYPVGAKNNDPDLTAQIFAEISKDPGRIIVLYNDKAQRVTAVQDLPAGILNSKGEATRFLRGRARAFGAPFIIVGAASSKLSDEQYHNLHALRQQGKLLAVANFDTGDITASRTQGDNLFPIKGLRVREEDAGEKIGGARKDLWAERGLDESGESGNPVMFSVAPPAPGTPSGVPLWVSRMREALEKKLPGRGTASQMRELLSRNAEKWGYKQAEVEESGVLEWLDGQEGRVTKAEVLAWLDAHRIAVEEVAPSETNYGEWQLPGVATGYRELLFTLPEDQTADPYISPHWDGKGNVLAHVRFNERTDAEGNLVLFVEEIQSDWHQKGRKAGYFDGADKAMLDFAWQDLEAAQEAEASALEDYGRDSAEWKEAHRDRKVAELLLSDLTGKLRKKAPMAPFRKNWHELVMKRMLRWAVDHGYSGVAWTTGEQQADRYDLSKKITKELSYNEKTGTLIGYSWGKARAGYTPVVKVFEKDDVSPSELSSYVGEDVARRLLFASPNRLGNRKLPANNLKVGGEGMAGFYDVMLPRFMNQYTKKWGSRVGATTVGVTKTTKTTKKRVGVHYLEITPAMREALTTQPQPLYSQESSAGGGSISEADLRNVVYNLTAKWSNTPTRIEVVERPEDLPASIQEAARESRTEVGRIRGVYDPASDRVYLVRSNLRNKAEAVFVATHEIVGHRGIEWLLGKENADRFFQRLARGRQGLIGAYARAHGMPFGTNAERMAAAREWLADQAGAGKIQGDAWYRRLLDLVRRALQRLTGRASWTAAEVRSITDAGLRRLLADAQRFTEKGNVIITEDRYGAAVSRQTVGASRREGARRAGQTPTVRGEVVPAYSQGEGRGPEFWRRFIGKPFSALVHELPSHPMDDAELLQLPSVERQLFQRAKEAFLKLLPPGRRPSVVASNGDRILLRSKALIDAQVDHMIRENYGGGLNPLKAKWITMIPHTLAHAHVVLEVVTRPEEHKHEIGRWIYIARYKPTAPEDGTEVLDHAVVTSPKGEVIAQHVITQYPTVNKKRQRYSEDPVRWLIGAVGSRDSDAPRLPGAKDRGPNQGSGTSSVPPNEGDGKDRPKFSVSETAAQRFIREMLAKYGTGIAGLREAMTAAERKELDRHLAEEKAAYQRRVSPAAFAERIHQVAAKVKAEGRFGEHKVYISDLHAAYEREHGSIPIEEFKRQLVAAKHAMEIELARADLVEAMPQAKLRASETRYLNATFHFLVDAPKARAFFSSTAPAAEREALSWLEGIKEARAA